MRHSFHSFVALTLLFILNAFAQAGPIAHDQIQLGCYQFLQGKGPQGASLYCFLKIPESRCRNLTRRYDFDFDTMRDGDWGAQSVGILVQFDFQAWKQKRADSG